jgi:curved DNA-binding protein CbpA
MPSARSHYDVLDLPPDAKADDIRRAWKTLIQVWHPDRFTGQLRSQAEDMTKVINAAYDVLGDPAKRAVYDSDHQGPTQQRPKPAGPDANGTPREPPHRQSTRHSWFGIEIVDDEAASRDARQNPTGRSDAVAVAVILVATFIAASLGYAVAAAGALIMGLLTLAVGIAVYQRLYR